MEWTYYGHTRYCYYWYRVSDFGVRVYQCSTGYNSPPDRLERGYFDLDALRKLKGDTHLQMYQREVK